MNASIPRGSAGHGPARGKERGELWGDPPARQPLFCGSPLFSVKTLGCPTGNVINAPQPCRAEVARASCPCWVWGARASRVPARASRPCDGAERRRSRQDAGAPSRWRVFVGATVFWVGLRGEGGTRASRPWDAIPRTHGRDAHATRSPRRMGWKPMPRKHTGWKPVPHEHTGWKPVLLEPTGWKPVLPG
jgi:hypothetical protein